MTQRSAAAVCFFPALASGNAAAAENPSPYITDTEYTALPKLLDDAQDRLMSRLTGMTDEQWSFRESPDRWSVADTKQIVEVQEDPNYPAKAAPATGGH